MHLHYGYYYEKSLDLLCSSYWNTNTKHTKIHKTHKTHKKDSERICFIRLLRTIVLYYATATAYETALLTQRQGPSSGSGGSGTSAG
jgi:hypothetical protein